MAVNKEAYEHIKKQTGEKGVTLIAVSKTKPAEDIRELYDLGHRDFGENYVQELVDKQAGLPPDIRWHFIGHLQTNKVKYIAPFVHLIHGVDSFKLLKEISRQAVKAGRTIKVLLQVHIAQEETKFGLDAAELAALVQQLKQQSLPNIEIAGLMGMASFTEDKAQVQAEFCTLKSLFDQYQKEIPTFQVLSMGMSGDYELAIAEGSTAVRIGSLLFGARNYNQT